MVKLCPLCGPKLSMFCMVICGWGIIFLGLLGIFFYLESGILIEDVLHEEDIREPTWAGLTKEAYRSNAINCWIASAMYLVTLVGAFWQNKWNSSTSSAPA